MAIDRRGFLVGALLALGTTASTGRLLAETSDASAAAFVTAARRADGTYAVLLLAENGNILREIPLSGRGHDIAIDPAARMGVVFARRPGYFAAAFDLAARSAPQVFTPEPGRHFFGHGAFSSDGRLIYTSENDIETGLGIIGIYEVGTWKRLGELASHGIGPHETILLADGRTLAVANGGFATDPATGREPIDVTGMEPSLAFLDVQTGELKAKHLLPARLNKLSIRHLAANARGEVWFGGQWQGGLEETPELIGKASRDRAIEIVEAAEPMGLALKGYIGSVAMSADGNVLAASAPRAGRIVLCDTRTGRTLRVVEIADGCGVAPDDEAAFALTSGHGVLRKERLDGPIGPDKAYEGTEFDNHLRRVVARV